MYKDIKDKRIRERNYYHNKNREKKLKYQKEYYKKNREKILAYQKKYKEINKELIKEKQKKKGKKYQKILEQINKRTQYNKEYQEKYYEKNRDKLNEYWNAYKNRETEKIKVLARRIANDFFRYKEKPKYCENPKCLNLAQEKHHWDYGKPLWVNWFCRKCHKLANNGILMAKNEKGKIFDLSANSSVETS